MDSPKIVLEIKAGSYGIFRILISIYELRQPAEAIAEARRQIMTPDFAGTSCQIRVFSGQSRKLVCLT
jgi:hypothetical protein